MFTDRDWRVRRKILMRFAEGGFCLYPSRRKKTTIALMTPLPKPSVPEMGSWLNFKWRMMAEEPSQRCGKSNKIIFFQNLIKELGFDFGSCDWWSYLLPCYIFKKVKWVNGEQHENRAQRSKGKINLPYKRERKSLVPAQFCIFLYLFCVKNPLYFYNKESHNKVQKSASTINIW